MSSFYHGDAAAAAVNRSSSFQVEKWPDPKGLIKSIDVLEAIRCLGSGHKSSPILDVTVCRVWPRHGHNYLCVLVF